VGKLTDISDSKIRLTHARTIATDRLETAAEIIAGMRKTPRRYRRGVRTKHKRIGVSQDE
jgi:hypothetical protein